MLRFVNLLFDAWFIVLLPLVVFLFSAFFTSCSSMAGGGFSGIQKLDKQNNRVLEGAVFELKQIDGSFRTTGRTEFDGVLELGTEAYAKLFGRKEESWSA